MKQPGIKTENVSIPVGIRPIGVFYSETPFTALSDLYSSYQLSMLLCLCFCCPPTLNPLLWYCFQIRTLTCQLTP